MGIWEEKTCRVLAPVWERCVMMNRPTTYLTKEELQEIAAAKFQEAATLPPGYQKDDSEVGREFPSSRRNERLVIQRIASAEAKHF